jgi:predicted nucleotidyltransferase
MGIDQELIDEIVRRVLSVIRPDRIILFGSAATGPMTKDSDIDLLIVQASNDDPRGQWAEVRRALRGLGYPFDILFIDTDWFDASKTVVGGIAYPAHKYGMVIYDAA